MYPAMPLRSAGAENIATARHRILLAFNSYLDTFLCYSYFILYELHFVKV